MIGDNQVFVDLSRRAWDKGDCDVGYREFDTGAVRDSIKGKGRPELISPIFLDVLSRELAAGAEKYSPRNWEKGMPFSDVVGSLFRHLIAFMLGASEEDHLGHLACNIMFLIDYRQRVKMGRLDKKLADMGPELATVNQPMGGLIEVPLTTPEETKAFLDSAKQQARGQGK